MNSGTEKERGSTQRGRTKYNLMERKLPSLSRKNGRAHTQWKKTGKENGAGWEDLWRKTDVGQRWGVVLAKGWKSAPRE